MTPSIDDRLASVIRALSDLILPSLPPEAGLAIEQAQLSIGQLQIIHAQLGAATAYEQEEADDACKLGAAMAIDGAGGPETTAALAALRTALDAGGDARETRIRINGAIDALVEAMATDGEPAWRDKATASLIAMEGARVMKDRRWFAPMGFDTL
jgi:hypothetical protein